MSRRKRSLEERFWSKVEKTDGCWLWTGALNQDGYGRFVASMDPQRVVGAHRVAFELVAGAVPHGMCVLHRCDVPRCVNPAHLFAGTQRENVADMIRKGRWGGYDPSACPAGHAYDETNTRFERNRSGGLSRKCRACDRLRHYRKRHPEGDLTYACQ